MPRGEYTIIVIKLSGSLFFSEEFGPVASALAGFVRRKKDLRLILVCGGGETARRYIDAGRKIGADNATLDELGIEVSRLNAHVMSIALGKEVAGSAIPTSLQEITEEAYRDKHSIIACGGLHPGQSTNAVAAIIAEKLSAKEFLNATDVDGVYDKDPRKFANARLLKQVSVKDLESILKSENMLPGGYDLMDPVALRLIARSKIPTRIVKCDAKTLMRALQSSRKSGGTRITFSQREHIFIPR